MAEKKNVICVRSLPEEPTMKVSFVYKSIGHELHREKCALASKTLQRIALKLNGKKSKKKKKKNPTNLLEKEEDTEISVVIISEESRNICNEEITNEEGFSEIYSLRIADENFQIMVNPPIVTSLSILDNIMSGFLIYPDVSYEFADAEKSKFHWYKQAATDNDWILVGEEMTYTPTNQDIGCILKVSCQPANAYRKSPILVDFETKNPVSAGPGICVFEERQAYTNKHCLLESDELRLVCYNILADVFATSDFAKTTLFPFCPEYILSSSYRKQLVIKELLGYHSDFICLQECGKKLFETFLQPILKLHGYEGFFELKLGVMPEGEAIFFRNERFIHVQQLSVSVRDALYMDCNISILSELTKAPSEVLESIHKKTAIGQIHLFQERQGKQRKVCILNTHLYYKRYSQHVRMLQIAVLMNYISAEVDIKNTSFLVCGDLNSLRTDPLLDYLSGAQIDGTHEVWNNFGQQKDKMNLTLKPPFTLQNLSGCPPFTSFVPHCIETLDYIFGDDNFELSAFIPLPTAEQLIPYIGIPCVGSPSDHLALVLDLLWR